MRSPWGTVVGGAAGVVGSVGWAVSLAIYQQLMEPSGFFADHDGTLYPNLAQNNTYWPREMRHLGILLALAGLVAIGRAAPRAFAAAATLGAGWLASDLWLDRIDIDGHPAALWLAGAGCVAVAGAAVVSRGGTPSRLGRYLAAGTAALLATAPMSITTPWVEPITGTDRVAIENAVTIMDITMATGFLAVAVAMLAPAMVTVRSRWLVPLGAAVTLAATVLIIAYGSPSGFAILGVVALAVTIVVAAEDVPLTRLILVAGATAIFAPCLVGVMLFSVFVPMGRAMTLLAGNPAVNSADTDVALALPVAFIGLAVAAASLAVIDFPAREPEPAGA